MFVAKDFIGNIFVSFMLLIVVYLPEVFFILLRENFLTIGVSLLISEVVVVILKPEV